MEGGTKEMEKFLNNRKNRRKKFFSVIFLGVAFVLVAAACSHDSNNAGEATTTTENTDPVVATTTTTAVTPTTSIGVPRPDSSPSEPQVQLSTRYILSAKPRTPDFQGRIPKYVSQIYHSPNGDLLTKQTVTDSVTGETRTVTRCLRDFPEDCFPTDPTFWNARLTFLVTQGAPGDEWAEVLISTRPNNTRGWVRTADYEWSAHDFHVIVDLGERTVSVWEGILPPLGATSATPRRLVSHSFAIIGGPSNPTPPIVTTYIEAKLFNMPAARAQGGFGPVYGTWIFPLAAFSDTLTEFGGSIPQIAIHGTDVPNMLGENISFGCIRLENSVIEQLAAMLPIGTPVSIIA